MSHKVLVSYSYYEASQTRYQDNLKFFLHEAVGQPCHDKTVDCTYVLVVQGHKCSVPIPPNVRVHYTDNTGFDLGAHGKALELYKNQKFDAYVFLNCGQRGPFLPNYWPTNRHWSYVFLDRLFKQEKPGIVGVSIFCSKHLKKPVVETWAFCMSRDALETIQRNTGVFQLHSSKHSAVHKGEHTLGPYLFDHKFGMDCLLYKYRNVDWQNQAMKCNNCAIPSRPWSYEDISIHPMEVVFYKTFWQSFPGQRSGYKCPYETRYTQWALGEDPKADKEELNGTLPSPWRNIAVQAVLCVLAGAFLIATVLAILAGKRVI